MSSDPITSVCVVADKVKCPPGHEVIASTTDYQDADLWKDKSFRKKITRYLCFSRTPQQNNTVLVDLTVIKEGEMIPTGYTCIAKTMDTGEPVLKKKLVLIHLISGSSTTQAITDIYFSSSKTKQKPVESSPRGDVNGMSLFLRMGATTRNNSIPGPIGGSNIMPPQGYNTTPTVFEAGNATLENLPLTTPYTNSNVDGMQYHSGSSSDQYVTGARNPMKRQNTLSKTLLRTAASSSFNVLWPIEGVPFEMNKIFSAVNNSSQFDVPRIEVMSAEQLEMKYHYDFSTEKQTKQRIVAPTP